MEIDANPVFDLEAKACAEALQFTQKRTRIALLLSMFYSMMAFKARDGHVECAGKFTKGLVEKNLISTLLETEKLPKPPALFSALEGVLLFLPFIACVAVGWYSFSAHFSPPLSSDPLLELIMKNRDIAQALDVAGLFFAIFVLMCNFQAFSFSRKIREEAKKCLPETSKTSDSTKAVAAGA